MRVVTHKLAPLGLALLMVATLLLVSQVVLIGRDPGPPVTEEPPDQTPFSSAITTTSETTASAPIPSEPATSPPARPVAAGRWRPLSGHTFQWQFSGELDLSVEADIFVSDYENTTNEEVAALHAAGRRVVCYINVGASEAYRPDIDAFPDEVLGNVYTSYPDERWLDIRRLDLLAPILEARFDLCQAKGFDALEPDNLDGYQQNTGFPLTGDDQVRFNQWVAEEAHARGLSIGLKNDGEQIANLIDSFDWAIVEDCVAQGFCADFKPFVDAGKVVVIIDYTDQAVTHDQICQVARAFGYAALLKNRDLDAYRETCPTES